MNTIPPILAERREGTRVGGHGLVGKEAPHHRPQPLSLLGDVLVPAPLEVLSNLQQLRRLAVTSRMAASRKPPRRD
jgi:hypothetical protein